MVILLGPNRLSSTGRGLQLARVAAAIATAAAAVILGAGCGAEPVRTAAFRARPDSVAPGSLLGPFTGRVVDAATGKALAGAFVYATWTVESGYGMTRPERYEQFVTSTDASGRYAVPAIDEPARRGSARVTDFYLLVYKRGYVAYRSDRRFSDFGPRRDFAQRRNQVSLERWREEFSHARHLRYVGGGPAVASLTSWEAEEAAGELFGMAAGARIAADLIPQRTGEVYLVAAQILTEEDVKEITGYDGAFESGPLKDEPDTATYSSQHLTALGRPETYDVALRIWRLDAEQSAERYQQLADGLPKVAMTDEIATKSLRATQDDIFGIAFLDSRRGIVALLTCGRSQCSSADAAALLGKKIFSRIEAIWPKDR